MSKGANGEKRRNKFNANKGYRPHLGYSVNSSLENNTACLLIAQGYQRWTEPHPSTPPVQGKFYRYEGREFTLPGTKGRVYLYKPDFHLWEDGRYTIWEAKGAMDQRSKRHDRLMKQHYPDIPLELITYPVLEQMKAAFLYETRRRGQMLLDVENWEG